MPYVTFGPFRLDLTSGELHRSGVPVKLQPQPSRLLALLVERAGETVTRDEIRRSVWGTETFVDFDQSVNFCIRQIRTALHDNAATPCYLETLPRRGYRFIAPVQRPSDASDAPPTVASPVVASSRPGRRRLAGASLALVLAAAAAIASAFHRVPSPPVEEPSTAAHQQVAIGRFFLNKVSRDDTLSAIQHFEEAIREDPQYAQAYVGLADAYNQLGTVFVAGKRPDNVRLLALRAATRATQLNPKLAEAYVSLGYTTMHELDWTQAETSLRRAIELNPRYAPAHQTYASYLVAQSRFAEAIDEARRALDLEPVSLRARHSFAWMLYFDRQYDAAIRELRTVLDMDRTYAMAQWRLGQVLFVAGRYDEAITTLQAAVDSTQRSPAALGLLAMAYGGRGERVEPQRIVDELEERSAAQNVPVGALTLAYLGAGNASGAIDALERVYTERDSYAIYVSVDPLMDPLRKEPRFQALCRRLMLGTPPPTDTPGSTTPLARR